MTGSPKPPGPHQGKGLLMRVPPPSSLWSRDTVQGADTHVAGRDDTVPAGAHHGLSHHASPPVILGARGVVHHGLQALLELISDGPVG